MTPPNAITLRELAFVRDVLIPRAWVQGAEVDEIIRLRARIDRIFTSTQAPQPEVPRPSQPEPKPPTEPLPRREGKKPRHPKRGRGKPQQSGG